METNQPTWKKEIR